MDHAARSGPSGPFRGPSGPFRGPVAVGVRATAASLLGLALPVDCAGCGHPDLALCPSCRAVLAGPARPVVVGGSLRGVPAFAAAEYGGRVARIVVAWKDRGRHDLSGPLAGALAVALGDMIARSWTADRTLGVPRRECVLVVPVPSSRAARRRRGEDTVRRLALLSVTRLRRAGIGHGLRVVPALRLDRPVADQSRLSPAQRRVNLSEAFRVRAAAAPAVTGQACLLVDDVLTTGATLGEAARALGAEGAQVTGVATVCVTLLGRTCDSPPNGVPVQDALH